MIAALALTHVTIASVTIYLHRCQAHRALDLHPVAAHFFRFWLWLTTGMVTKEWAAIHRKHHAKVETAEDPHSPQIYGINRVLWLGVFLYVKESFNKETMERYGHGTPDDWMERNVYTSHAIAGVMVLLALNLLIFGIVPGALIWLTQIAWIPFWAAGVINGVGHYFGYRSYDVPDASTNIVPWGILIGGEELHNNHHAFAASAKLSSKWYEFDIGWMYICILESLGLATVKRLAPTPRVWGDRNLLGQIVANLVMNAIQAIRGALAEGEVRIHTRANGESVLLEVSDSGPGVPAELAARIFEPFFTTKPAGEGTGLGLAVTRQLVERLGGRIQLLSSARGAHFQVELPLAREPSA